MVEVHNIYKSYGSLQVLKGVDMVINDNEIVSITGASGAGKSTLLHIIGTLDTATSGEVRIDGTNIAALPASKLAVYRNKNIGFVFQFHHLLPEFTALENICIPAWINGMSRKKAEIRAYELLDMMGLMDRALHKPSELSGGEQQRVSVSRALVNNPKVVLADEPSGNLDSNTRNELHKLFFSLRDELGQTFIIVTHDNDLAAMSDRQIHLKDGIVI